MGARTQWRHIACSAMKWYHHVYNWVMSPWHRARRAEARLAQVESATITVRVIIDGNVVAQYPITAYRLDSLGDWAGPNMVTAAGDGAIYTITTDVQVSLQTGHDPDKWWRAQRMDD